MVTASRCHEHLIFNSSQGLFSTIPPPLPQEQAAGTCFWSSCCLCLAACLTVRDERVRSLATPGGCCQGAPSRAAAFLGQHSRMGHTRCFEGWNCIPAQWDLPAPPVLELLSAYFSKCILSFSFKGASTSEKCFLLS